MPRLSQQLRRRMEAARPRRVCVRREICFRRTWSTFGWGLMLSAFSLSLTLRPSQQGNQSESVEVQKAVATFANGLLFKQLGYKKGRTKSMHHGPWTMESLSEERRVLIGLRAALQAFNACCVRARCSTMLNTLYPQKDDSFEWVWPRYGPKTMWLWYDAHRHPYVINP